MLANPVLGDIDKGRCAGEGVVIGVAWLEICSLSERSLVLANVPLARASAVALADSSTVPVW